MNTKVPNPGSNEAIDLGCTCPVIDNAHGKGSYRGGFIISGDCPVHNLTIKVSEGWKKTWMDKYNRISLSPDFEEEVDFIVESAIAEDRERISAEVTGLKPILWNDDPNRHLENVAKYNTLDQVLNIITPTNTPE